jgi:uncharacterized protein (DUF2236 family)
LFGEAAGIMKASKRPLFDPAGVFWRVNRETVLLLAGGAALLSQIAHPLVAAGVHEHSGFRSQPLRRLYGTITAMQRMIYGPAAEARATARRIQGIHRRVHGELSEDTATFRRGTRYDARDPELLLWVHSTLAATAVDAYQVFFPALSAEERRAYYEESKLIGRLLGLAPNQMPADWEAFQDYYQNMLAGDVLEVTPVTRELARHILYPPVVWLPRRAGDVVATATVPLLRPELRRKYALPWSHRRARAWSLASRGLRRVLPYMPGPARSGPRLWYLERRLRASAG